MSKRTNGDVLNELAQVGIKAQGGLKKTDPVKALAHLAPSKEAPKPKKRPEAGTYEGKAWDQARISKAMERDGLTGRALAEQLESSRGTTPSGVQVNRWCRGAELIPEHYWPQLERILGGGK